MRTLILNKFLHRNGGSETYIFKLGEALEQHGHEVQYFGMEHEGRCVGNRVNAYTSDMDFHGGSKLSKLTYPIKTIYSKEAREKLRLIYRVFEKLHLVHLFGNGLLAYIFTAVAVICGSVVFSVCAKWFLNKIETFLKERVECIAKSLRCDTWISM